MSILSNFSVLHFVTVEIASILSFQFIHWLFHSFYVTVGLYLSIILFSRCGFIRFFLSSFKRVIFARLTINLVGLFIFSIVFESCLLFTLFIESLIRVIRFIRFGCCFGYVDCCFGFDCFVQGFIFFLLNDVIDSLSFYSSFIVILSCRVDYCYY